jgi:hypothetical protein
MRHTAPAVRAHHNQVDLVPAGIFDDRCGWCSNDRTGGRVELRDVGRPQPILQPFLRIAQDLFPQPFDFRYVYFG